MRDGRVLVVHRPRYDDWSLPKGKLKLGESWEAAAQPELIAATTDALHPLVLVEGHARLTAYALFPERLPAQLEVLLGISPEMPGWCQF